VSLIVWPGGRDNPNNVSRSPTIGFLDIKLPDTALQQPAYGNLYEKTAADVAEMSKLPPEGAARHDVTFCLHRDAEAILADISPSKAAQAR
jgi:hypothetical protein